MKNNKKAAALLLSLALACGAYSQTTENSVKVSRNINVYATVMRELDRLFVDEINPEKLTNSALKAMLETLDPYTVFYPESEVEKLKLMTSGEYAGIGAAISPKDNKVIIRQPYTGSPAQKAGLLPGDTIVAIDGEWMQGAGSDKVSERLKGSPGSTATIEVKRRGTENPLSFTLERQIIQFPSVPYFGMLDAQTGYIAFSSFTEKSAADFRNALVALQEKGAASLVIDLRDNGGGSLEQAVEILGLFLPKGSKVVTIKGRETSQQRDFFTPAEPLAPDMPVAVLINGNSASASEILSGALQDYDRAVVLGERSFGKGLVQTVRNMPYNSQLKLTTAKYYIPSGRCIQAVDYKNRNADGSAAALPDSLMQQFKTRAGRPVTDGRGILPDVQVARKDYVGVALNIANADKAFDFVSRYALLNPSVAPARNFEITDALYGEFADYLEKNGFSYETETEAALKTFIETAKKESYYDKNKATFDRMQKELKHSLRTDMDLGKDDVKEMLAYAFVLRYYNNEGALEYRSMHDEVIAKAKTLLQTPAEYKKQLQMP